MSTTTAKVGQPTRNNGATVMLAGNIDATETVTNALGKDILSFRSGIHGSRIPSPETNATIAAGTATAGVFKAVDAGLFAKMTAGEYIIRRQADKIAGVSNTVLNSGASDFGRNSIHKKENRRTTRMIQAGWNFATGQFLTDPVNALDSFGNDDAARPTRAIPGELVLFVHGPSTDGALAVPLQDDYKAKTG